MGNIKMGNGKFKNVEIVVNDDLNFFGAILAANGTVDLSFSLGQHLSN